MNRDRCYGPEGLCRDPINEKSLGMVLHQRLERQFRIFPVTRAVEGSD